MWHFSGLIEIIKTDAKPFVDTYNIVNALLCMDDIGIVIFYGRDDQVCWTSYTITQRYGNKGA